MNISDIFERTVQRYPERLALVDGKKQWSYEGWQNRVHRLALALSNLGVRPLDRVALYLQTSEATATAYFAIQLIGAVAVPINFRAAPGEAAYIIDDAGAHVLVYSQNLLDQASEIQRRMPHLNVIIGTLDDSSKLPAGHLDFEALINAAEYRKDVKINQSPDNLSALVYTSGTTGRPKGVMHTHGNDVAIAMNCAMEYSLNHRDVALHICPLYHVGGMQAYFIPHLLVGGANVILRKYEPEVTMQVIQQHKVTTLFAVPTQIQDMLFDKKRNEYDLSSLRMITTGGAAIAPATMERVVNELCAGIFNGYGMTEASLTLVLHPNDAIARLGSVGKASLISECRIILNDPSRDVKPDEIVRSGEIGELIVRGPQAMQGYWRNPIETAKKIKNGWIYTGDLFSTDEDGYHFFHGRADDMIISGGENIYPREVEDILYRVPGVQEASVIGVPDEKWGQIVTAYIVRSDAGLSPEEIDRTLRNSADLASFKRPKRYEFLDSLPTNPSGKVLKRELLQYAMQGKAS